LALSPLSIFKDHLAICVFINQERCISGHLIASRNTAFRFDRRICQYGYSRDRVGDLALA